jgi:hypothetical protein
VIFTRGRRRHIDTTGQFCPQAVLLQEVPVICYKQPDGINLRSSETRDE